jgi:hypothetical protein
MSKKFKENATVICYGSGLCDKCKGKPHYQDRLFRCKVCGWDGACALAMAAHLIKEHEINVDEKEIEQVGTFEPSDPAPRIKPGDKYFAVSGSSDTYSTYHSTNKATECTLLNAQLGGGDSQLVLRGYRTPYDAANNELSGLAPRKPCSECCKGVDDHWVPFQTGWPGKIGFRGSAEVYRDFYHRHLRSSFHFGTEGDDLCMAKGTLTVEAIPNALSKVEFLKYSHVMDSWIEDFDDESLEDFPDDMLPDLSKLKVRIFSETLCLLENSFSEEAKEAIDDLGYYFLEGGQVDVGDIPELPEGFLLAEGEVRAQVELDLASLSARLLNAHFLYPDKVEFPTYIDLRIGWYADWSEAIGDGVECNYASSEMVIATDFIGWERSPTAKEHVTRVVAGPSQSSLKFVLNPSSKLRLKPDLDAVPQGYISTLVVDDQSTIAGELFVIGSRGEVDRIGRMGSSKNEPFQPPVTPPAIA